MVTNKLREFYSFFSLNFYRILTGSQSAIHFEDDM